jgi:hypothetical protein
LAPKFASFSIYKTDIVSAINGVISLSFFLPPGCFSPRRSYRRVPKFCMGFLLTKKIVFGVNKFGVWGVDFLGFFRKKTKKG